MGRQQVVSENVFNVVCVSQFRGFDLEDDQHTLWHRDIQGQAKVVTTTQTDGGIPFVSTTVEFNGKICSFIKISHGLDGSCLCLIVKVPDEFRSIWKLYTDTPTDEPDRPDREVDGLNINTPDGIRQNAKETINRTVEFDRKFGRMFG